MTTLERKVHPVETVQGLVVILPTNLARRSGGEGLRGATQLVVIFLGGQKNQSFDSVSRRSVDSVVDEHHQLACSCGIYGSWSSENKEQSHLLLAQWTFES